MQYKNRRFKPVPEAKLPLRGTYDSEAQSEDEEEKEEEQGTIEPTLPKFYGRVRNQSL
jgi:hypothetical protein